MNPEKTLPPYLDPAFSPEARAENLIARMTLAEKVSQMMDDAPEIERLGIPAYNWWNEALHGVARAGKATVFPQAIALAATWNEELILRMASAISDEARAKHHQALREGVTARYTGLTFWSPNINIFRDPRWGRGQETFGEDPTLTARIGVNFVRGMQGEDPHLLKTAACAKHFAVHSGPEAARHHFDARVSPHDLADTYLPAFETLVREADVAGVMGAYNRTNGEACCASPFLLQETLRGQWGFEGYVVSDCGAIRDIHAHHRLAESPKAAAAMAVEAGCDLNCGCTYEYLLAAVGRGLLAEREIDRALLHLFTIRFRLGMFDPLAQVPYAQIPIEANASPTNQVLALEVARQSLVLLKNEGSCLPLAKDISRIAVIGPHGDDALVMLGNYYGTPVESSTLLAGIRGMVSPATEVTACRGCDILEPGQGGFEEAVAMAQAADVVVMALGLSQQVEGEEGQEEGNPEGVLSRGDREALGLPGEQEALLKAVANAGTLVVLVLLNGGPVSVCWADENIPAILEAWYPGQAGGRAVAEALFGDYNPGGRLPVTVYRSEAQLPPFENYAMEGRTYRYFDGEVLYPFGYGLSYTNFEYHNLSLSQSLMPPLAPVQVTCEVRNAGKVTGDEVVQVYLRHESAPPYAPRHSLVGFQRMHLAPGAVEQATFEIQPRQLTLVNEAGERVFLPGRLRLFVGGGQPGEAGGLSAELELTGEPLILAE